MTLHLIHCFQAALLTACCASLAPAADPSAPWGADPLARATLATPGPTAATLRPIADPVHGDGVELATLTTADHPWQIQLSIPTIADLAKGDVLVAEFWARTVRTEAESGEGTTTLVIERSGDPWTKSVDSAITLPGDGGWSRRMIGGRCEESYPPGAAQLNFQIGTFRPQVIQLAGLTVRNLGPGVDLATLPLDRATYPGRSATAAWRADAAARIERYRKQDLAITVRDATGAPLSGANVRVVTSHPAFEFGTAVALDRVLDPGVDGERYRAWILAHCNRIVAENHLKWPWFTPGNPDRDIALKALDWATQHGLSIKGHVLHWPSWRNSPSHLSAMDNVALAKACDERIADALTATRTYPIREWDVVNEAYANHDLLDRLSGIDTIAHWFHLARQHFAGDLLYNDYCHLVDAGRMNDHKRYAESLMKRLRTMGAPITGYGIQAHIGGSLADPAQVIAELDRLGRELDIDLHITELDVNLRDEACQAEFQRDFMTACFAAPRVRSLIIWGFWEGRHWIPAAALFRTDWSAKPVAQAVEQLVASWRTDVRITSDADGHCRVRAFKGRTTVVATSSDGRQQEHTVQLADAPAQLAITVP